MINTIAFFLWLSISVCGCMHSAYKLGYTKGYRRGKLIAFLEELDRKENK
jgi:hypothetical protein